MICEECRKELTNEDCYGHDCEVGIKQTGFANLGHYNWEEENGIDTTNKTERSRVR